MADMRLNGLDRETPMQIFMPLVQQPRNTVFAVLRTKSPQAWSAIEAAFHAFQADIPVYNERTLDQVMTEANSRRQVTMVVLSLFSVVAVFLSAVGLYSVIAHSVVERRQEIGVRMALGATQGQVLRLFLRYGLTVVAFGMACGLIGALTLSRSLQSLVFGVTPTDPLTLAAVTVLLTSVALAACYLPARAATRVDPLIALRAE